MDVLLKYLPVFIRNLISGMTTVDANCGLLSEYLAQTLSVLPH